MAQTAGGMVLPPEIKCQRCGACCRGYIPVTEDDLLRWAGQGRDDILWRVWPEEMIIGPTPRDEAMTCPFLVPLPVEGIALCSIHSTKPDACAAFPSSVEQAARANCPGFLGAADPLHSVPL
jgi:Fe-S-cluster containining protein